MKILLKATQTGNTRKSFGQMRTKPPSKEKPQFKETKHQIVTPLSDARIVGPHPRKERKSGKKSSIAVTGGALTLILLAASMVTATFLMSPVIEEMFGK